VFWKAFLGSRRGYEVGIPSVPLGDLYEGCRAAVEALGGEVRLRAGVREICMNAERFAGVTLEDGTEVSADACVLAVPHQAAAALLLAKRGAGCPDGVRSVCEELAHIHTSPITGVHLWFDREVMDEPFLTLLDHTTQWVFNKTLLSRNANAQGGKAARATEPTANDGAARGQYLQLVISASYDLVPLSRQEIIDLCMRELVAVLKEVHATFSPEPGVDRWRPNQNIGMENLFLAGDWTRTGWPSTMEGAVRSGYLAAEALLAASGAPRKFLRPDLPFEGLSKMWWQRAEKARLANEN
jgi:phytoene dehydrogenase-like protein